MVDGVTPNLPPVARPAIPAATLPGAPAAPLPTTATPTPAPDGYKGSGRLPADPRAAIAAYPLPSAPVATPAGEPVQPASAPPLTPALNQALNSALLQFKHPTTPEAEAAVTKTLKEALAAAPAGSDTSALMWLQGEMQTAQRDDEVREMHDRLNQMTRQSFDQDGPLPQPELPPREEVTSLLAVANLMAIIMPAGK